LPEVDATAYVDPSAQVIGRVRIGPRVFIGPCAVIRADEADASGRVQPIEIGAECNVQDGVIIHALGGTRVTIGSRTSLAHGCIIHGPCSVGEGCFIGFRAVVFDADLGDGVFVGTGAVVEAVTLASGALVPSAVSILSPEGVAGLAKTGPTEQAFMERVIAANLGLVEGYRGARGT
jgi:carbonic anhydrase/acetyltransferase-like protein (isoleucine patch superfamily)